VKDSKTGGNSWLEKFTRKFTTQKNKDDTTALEIENRLFYPDNEHNEQNVHKNNLDQTIVSPNDTTTIIADIVNYQKYYDDFYDNNIYNTSDHRKAFYIIRTIIQNIIIFNLSNIDVLKYLYNKKNNIKIHTILPDRIIESEDITNILKQKHAHMWEEWRLCWRCPYALRSR
jgi:hypothetical protein